MKIVIILLCIIVIIIYLITNRPLPSKNLSILGKEAIKNKNLILCTCIRDAEDNIKSIKKTYYYFSRYFKKVKLLVMENDSIDHTRKKLFELKKNNIDIDIVGCGINNSLCKLNLNNIRTGRSYKRFRRMAIIRNQLISHIKSIQNDYEYCIIFDGDMDMKIDTCGFLESMYYLEYKKRIEAVTCYGIGHASLFTLNKMYDGIAYKPLKNNNLIDLLTSFRLSKITKVKSSFNGLSIYKLPFLDKMKYDEQTKECEHISFNSYFNIYINPRFTILFDRIW